MELEYIPGEAHVCLYDDSLTLVQMNDSFLRLVGYSLEEIKRSFHSSFMEIIYPTDRPVVLKTIKEQLERGDCIDLEYRIRRKEGKLLWISDRGKLICQEDGSKAFCCILLDITNQKDEREELRLSLERHKIIMNQTNDIIFEWNMQKDTLDFSTNWSKKFGYEPLTQCISQAILQSPNIHSVDMPAFQKIMEDSAAGIPYSETEFRIRDVLGNYNWCRIRATVQYDDDGIPVKATGVILNIDKDKKQQQYLMERAQRDSLTGLLNKAATKDKVEELLRQRGNLKGALFIMDLDDFKSVNDRFGHLCGDALLSDTSHALQQLCNTGEVIGRIGGDEILLYIPDVSAQQAKQKAEEIIITVANIPVHHEKRHISCSVGIAMLPRDAQDFYNLYQCADQALYCAKTQGKGCYAEYSSERCENIITSGATHSAVNTEIDSDLSTVNEKLAQYSFQMLYRSVDMTVGINRVLEMVGKAYAVSRAYIFERSEDERTCSNTFEWCEEGTESVMSRRKHISYGEDIGDYLNNFNEGGIFYCKDIQELNPRLSGFLKSQSICSMLQCAIIEDGQFKGYVGVDDCCENRYWTKEQVESLTLISNVLSTFILKQRYKEAALPGNDSVVK